MTDLTLFDLDLRPAPSEPPSVAAEGTLPRLATGSPVASGAAAVRPPRLLAVDGNSLAHRAFHAYADSDLTDSQGRPRGAVYGFLALLAGICDRVDPDAVVVGFDCRQRSDRRERYPAYKAQRPDKDPSLTLQLDDLAWLLDRLGAHVVRPEGWEADDVLGSAAAAAEAAGWDCVLTTSDRDSYGLLSERTSLLQLGSGLDRAVEITAASLPKRVGVGPAQYLEFAALRGDSSDNLPGILGIGAKRAKALLREYPSVAAAAADPIGCRSVLGRPLGQALLDDLSDPATSVFHRNIALMTIRRDLPVDVDAGRRSVSADDVERYLLAVELPTLVRRVAVALAVRPDLPPPPGDDDAPPF